MPIRTGFLRRALLAASVLLAAALAPAGASAGSIDIIHAFCTPSCGNGYSPAQPLARDASGNLFGVTAGGTQGLGVVYELIPSPRGRWKYQVLHYFCAKNGCVDGSVPDGALVIDGAGNLYGMAQGGGTGNDAGLIFELSPTSKPKRWNYRVVYNFCSAFGGSCRDGKVPSGGLTYQGAQSGALYDGVSPLYGVTQQGGRRFAGVVFSVQPHAGAWVELVIYPFCVKTCTGGSHPTVRPTFDGAGNLYGVTSSGGSTGNGAVYKLSPQAPPSGWTLSVLHTFCAQANCEDGGGFASSLVMDAAGNLFGTTEYGGTNAGCRSDQGCGVLYEIAADGTEKTLYDFCQLANCTDGWAPVDNGGLVLDAAGEIVGTAANGGANGEGVVFKVAGGSYQVVHDFCAQACADGGEPLAGLITDPAGTLYGTTNVRGGVLGGAAFALTP
ncbi:MAG: hypothetical protein JOZ72_03225 [Alphaproteobacteria bacterium]|nr:hypothetical protein [Alphaproteobacteria bacterium]